MLAVKPGFHSVCWVSWFLSEVESALPRRNIASLDSCLLEGTSPDYTNASIFLPVDPAVDWDVDKPSSLLAFSGSSELIYNILGHKSLFMLVVKICHF